jgi:polygalacturonase
MNFTVCITDYGAKPDGTIQTGNIQKAIDDCFAHGGGTVIIPSGEFLTGGLRLRSNITLHLESGAVLKGTRNPEDYFAWQSDEIEPVNHEKLTDDLWVNVKDRKSSDFLRLAGSRWNNAIIRVIDAENVAIIGEEGSVIDGCDCYDEIGEENYRGPHGINIRESKNITLKGYKIQNTGNWANTIFYSQNIPPSPI